MLKKFTYIKIFYLINFFYFIFIFIYFLFIYIYIYIYLFVKFISSQNNYFKLIDIFTNIYSTKKIKKKKKKKKKK